MVNKAERKLWEDAFLQAGMQFAGRNRPPPSPSRVRAWARSMAMIAEQFIERVDDAEEEASAG